MLRIHFTAEDLGRTRVAQAPDPIWEATLSLHRLRARDAALVLSRWRRRVRERLASSDSVGQLRMLLPLVPIRGYFPDFLTPADSELGLDAGIEAIRSTPTSRLRTELAVLAEENNLPGWAAQLSHGEPETLRQVAEALARYYAIAIAPFESQLRAQLDADRAVRARAMMDGGCEGLLSSLRPQMRWERPVLEVDYPTSQDLHLDGRGLLLVPSFFCWGHPISLMDPTLDPVLVYPVERDPNWFDGVDGTGPRAARRGSQPVAALLGATRAAVLATVAVGCTTGELARRLRISQSSASQHATVLRNAGLIASRRHGAVVLHTLTPLGAQLLAPRTVSRTSA